MKTLQQDPVASQDLASPFRTEQDWGAYSEVDHEVWRLLFERRMTDLEKTGSRVYLDGARVLGLSAHQVPDLGRVNEELGAATGWSALPVTGFVPAMDFFRCLAERRFPTTITVRPPAQLDYLPEPDIFHDVFGHVPLHVDPAFADFLQAFGRTAARAAEPHEITAMARFFWFTVEFGLIHERGDVRVYGSGLISSAGDAANALSGRCERRSFQLEDVIGQPFEIDRFQDVLFVVESFDQIVEAVDVLAERLGLGTGR